MSYRLDIALDAQADWRRLDVELQEVTLDELDRLLDKGASLLEGVIIHDLAVQLKGRSIICFYRFTLVIHGGWSH